ncbi:MAG: CHASE domain-containing protein [Verrucomicrobia bacterium]|nr:CHASE domain-containing protein [Verrucomicrobiota bacterium]
MKVFFRDTQLAWFVLAMSLLATALAARIFDEQARALTQARFDRQVDWIKAKIGERLLDYEQVLMGAQSLFAASKLVERDEWRAFINGLSLSQQFPGISGIGFVALVPGERLDVFLKNTRKEGAPGFDVKPAGKRDDYFVVKYIEPLKSNAIALGYDIGSEPVRRRAAESARDTGKSSVTSKITLIQDNAHSAGFSLLLPIYRNGAPHATVGERRRAIEGWVYAPIRMSDLMRMVLKEKPPEVDFQVFDDRDLTPDHILFDSGNAASHLDSRADDAGRVLVSSCRLTVGGRLWNVCVRSRPEFDAGPERSWSVLIQVVGVVVSLLIFGITWSLATARRRARAMAEEMTESLRLKDRAIGSSMNGVVITDPNQQDNPIIYVNPAFERMTGYSAAEVLGRNPRFLQCAEQDSHARNSLREALREGKGCRVVLQNLRKDGAPFWNELSISPVRDEDGRLIHWVGVSMDITGRKAAEQRLVMQYMLSRSLADSETLDAAATRILQTICEVQGWKCGAFWRVDSSAGVLRCVKFWRGTVANLDEFAAASREIAFAPGVGLPGRVWANRAPEWVADVFGDPNFPRAPSLAKSGLHSAFGFPIRSGGDVEWVMEFFSDQLREPDKGLLQTLDAIGGQIGQFIKRKQAEEEARDSANRVRAIVDTAVDGIITINEKGIVETFNPAAVRLFGWSAEDVIGRNVNMLMPKPYHDEHDGYLKRYIETGQKKLIGNTREVLGLRKNGTTFPIELAVSEVRLGDRRIFTGMTHDLSERKRVEDAMVRARDAALESARIKSEFLANMSHEIRTPMNGVVGMTGLLLDTPLNAEQRGFVEVIRSSSDLLLTVINDTLDFSKIEAGMMRIEIVDFNLNIVAKSAAELVAEQSRKKNIGLLQHVESQVPVFLRGDPGRLRQVLTNLLSNAVKFTRQGEVRLEIAKESEDSAHVTLRFQVKDTGIGISEEEQKCLFQAFSQVDASTTRKHGGTGLGLAISRRLVELMGGRIGVESSPGKGSVFWFTLKLEKQPPGSEDATTTSLTGMRVLIVDDNPTNLTIVQHQIVSWGTRTDTASGAAETLSLLRREAAAGDPYQIVLFRFPQTNQATAKLRPSLVLRRLPGPFDDWLICMISSQLEKQIPGFDEVITAKDTDFTTSGLKTDSVIRIARLAVAQRSVLLGAIGQIAPERLTRLKSKLREWMTGR